MPGPQFTIEDASPPQFTIEDAPASDTDQIHARVILSPAPNQPAMEIKAPPKQQIGGPIVAQQYSDPISRYFTDAENLTEEGKRQHPIEATVGKVAKGVTDFAKIPAAMSILFSGPAAGVGEAAIPIEAGEAAGAARGLPAGRPGPIEAPAVPEAPPIAGPSRPPNAGGTREFTGLRTSQNQGIIVPKTPPRIAGENMLPPGPSEAQPVAGPILKGSTPQKVEQLVNTAYGVKPLEPNVSLIKQLEGSIARVKPAEAPVAGPQSDLASRYPDKAIRQMVHANGEKIVDAIGGDPDLMREVHDLRASDLQKALLESGEDLGQKVISSSKFLGPEGISRQDAFDRLLAKGYSPREIVKLAKGPKQLVSVP